MADALYNNARMIGGDLKPKRVPGTVASLIKAGDFLVMVSSKASPVSELGDSGTLAQNQEAAHDVFLGVSLDQKLANDTRDVLIATAGEAKYPCNTGNVGNVGAFVGIEGSGAGLAVGLEKQKVVLVATANLAIGKLSRAVATGDTVMYFELAAAVPQPAGGTQAAA